MGLLLFSEPAHFFYLIALNPKKDHSLKNDGVARLHVCFYIFRGLRELLGEPSCSRKCKITLLVCFDYYKFFFETLSRRTIENPFKPSDIIQKVMYLSYFFAGLSL